MADSLSIGRDQYPDIYRALLEAKDDKIFRSTVGLEKERITTLESLFDGPPILDEQGKSLVEHRMDDDPNLAWDALRVLLNSIIYRTNEGVKERVQKYQIDEGFTLQNLAKNYGKQSPAGVSDVPAVAASLEYSESDRSDAKVVLLSGQVVVSKKGRKLEVSYNGREIYSVDLIKDGSIVEIGSNDKRHVLIEAPEDGGPILLRIIDKNEGEADSRTYYLVYDQASRKLYKYISGGSKPEEGSVKLWGQGKLGISRLLHSERRGVIGQEIRFVFSGEGSEDGSSPISISVDGKNVELKKNDMLSPKKWVGSVVVGFNIKRALFVVKDRKGTKLIEEYRDFSARINSGFPEHLKDFVESQLRVNAGDAEVAEPVVPVPKAGEDANAKTSAEDVAMADARVVAMTTVLLRYHWKPAEVENDKVVSAFFTGTSDVLVLDGKVSIEGNDLIIRNDNDEEVLKVDGWEEEAKKIGGSLIKTGIFNAEKLKEVPGLETLGEIEAVLRKGVRIPQERCDFLLTFLWEQWNFLNTQTSSDDVWINPDSLTLIKIALESLQQFVDEPANQNTLRPFDRAQGSGQAGVRSPATTASAGRQESEGKTATTTPAGKPSDTGREPNGVRPGGKDPKSPKPVDTIGLPASSFLGSPDGYRSVPPRKDDEEAAALAERVPASADVDAKQVGDEIKVAWRYLGSVNWVERLAALRKLGELFDQISEELLPTVVEDIRHLFKDKNHLVRATAVRVLGDNFELISGKERQWWEETRVIIAFTEQLNDKIEAVQAAAIDALARNSSSIPDRQAEVVAQTLMGIFRKNRGEFVGDFASKVSRGIAGAADLPSTKTIIQEHVSSSIDSLNEKHVGDSSHLDAAEFLGEYFVIISPEQLHEVVDTLKKTLKDGDDKNARAASACAFEYNFVLIPDDQKDGVIDQLIDSFKEDGAEIVKTATKRVLELNMPFIHGKKRQEVAAAISDTAPATAELPPKPKAEGFFGQRGGVDSDKGLAKLKAAAGELLVRNSPRHQVTRRPSLVARRSPNSLSLRAKRSPPAGRAGNPVDSSGSPRPFGARDDSRGLGQVLARLFFAGRNDLKAELEAAELTAEQRRELIAAGRNGVTLIAAAERIVSELSSESPSLPRRSSEGAKAGHIGRTTGTTAARPAVNPVLIK